MARKNDLIKICIQEEARLPSNQPRRLGPKIEAIAAQD